MSAVFDPYQSWLGIPRQEQPPHHYRLLGIAPLEANPAVIQAAAERQTKLLQMQGVGPYIALAQQMCGEVAAARHCLLTAASKAAYDAQLQSRMAKSPSRPLPVAAAIPVAAPQQAAAVHAATAPPRAAPAPSRPKFIPQTDAPPAVDTSAAEIPAGPAHPTQPVFINAGQPAASNASQAAAKSFNRRPPAPAKATAGRSAFEIAKIAIGGVAGLMMAVLILNYFVGIDPLGWSVGSRKGENKDKKVADAKRTPPGTIAPGNSANSNQPISPFPNLPTPNPGQFNPGPANFGPPPGNPSSPPPNGGFPSSSSPPVQPSNPLRTETRPPTSESVPPGDEPRSLPDVTNPSRRPGGEKWPLPSAADQAKKLTEIKDIYQSEFAAVKPGANPEFVSFLLTTARKVEGDEVAQFVLFQEAFRQACAGGEIEKAAAALDELETEFENEPFGPRFELLSKMATVAKANDDRLVVVHGALGLVDHAAALGKHEEADKLARIADSQAKFSGDRDLKAKAQAALQKTAELTKDLSSVKEAEAKLAQVPEDPAANLAFGRYQCLIAGDWEKGLAHLAKGDDEEVKRAATLDAAGPSGEMTAGKIGDAWYELAKAGKGQNFYVRADHWYQKGIETEAGLAQARSKKRHEEIAHLKLPPQTAGPSASQLSWPTGKELVNSGGGGELPATDLLPLVNWPKASPLKGWMKQEGSLASPSEAQGVVAFVETNFQPPRREYTLQARVTRTVDTGSKGNPAGAVIFGLTHKGKRFALIIDDLATGDFSGRRRIAYLSMAGEVNQNSSVVHYNDIKLRSDDVVCNVTDDKITVWISGNRLLEYTGDMSKVVIPPGSKFTPAKPFFYAQEGGINVIERWSVGPLVEKTSTPPGFPPNGPPGGPPNRPSRPGPKIKLGPKM